MELVAWAQGRHLGSLQRHHYLKSVKRRPKYING